MKLVSAKCPSCGANLDVNPNDEAMKCKYCQNAILIDDAIAKYKLEISGQIEIKNLPKLDNYLNLAERNYNNKNYDEAYKNYGSVIELDPNNTIGLLRYAICKTMLNNYIDFKLDYLIKTINDVVKILKDTNNYEENIESYTKEIIYAIDESLFATRRYYNSYTATESDLNDIQKKLVSIVNCYEIVIEHTSESKEYIIKQIISVIKDVIKDKNYKSGHGEFGEDIIKKYRLSAKDKIYYINRLNHYQKILDPSFIEEKTDDNKITKINKNNTIFFWDIFLCCMIIGSAMSGQFVSSIIMLMIFLVITFDKISYVLFKDNNKKKKQYIIAFIIILFFAIAFRV